MDCDVIQQKIETYLDGELTLSDRRDFEEHVEYCTSCEAGLSNMRVLQKMICDADYKNHPVALKRNIQKQLKDYTGEDNNAINWFGIGGGSLALGSITTWAFMTFIFAAPIHLQLADEVIASHVRSLMVDHVTDVKSSDRHTVKPWFNGRVDYSPDIRDLKTAGFELIGGRLDYIQGKTVSALVYKRRQHIINAFVFKQVANESKTTVEALQRQGYNIMHWSKNGLAYWVISDLNQKELKEFTLLFSGA